MRSSDKTDAERNIDNNATVNNDTFLVCLSVQKAKRFTTDHGVQCRQKDEKCRSLNPSVRTCRLQYAKGETFKHKCIVSETSKGLCFSLLCPLFFFSLSFFVFVVLFLFCTSTLKKERKKESNLNMLFEMIN